jgi:hypothetical protein
LSRVQPCMVRSSNGSARGISRPFKTRTRQMKLKNRQLPNADRDLAATSFAEDRVDDRRR